MEGFRLTRARGDCDLALHRAVHHTLRRLLKIENLDFCQNLLLFSNFDFQAEGVRVLQHLFLVMLRR